MKKLICLILCVMLLTTGCDSAASLPVRGSIEEYDNQLKVFFLHAYTGEGYSCFVNEETEFIITTDGKKETYVGMDVELCEILQPYADATVTMGDSFTPEVDPFQDESNVCCWAKTIKITYDTSMIATTAKPVIYFYPEQETAVSVALDYAGKLTCTYPKYNDGWTVTAAPDGTLRDAAGQTYNYLYWEGVTDTEYDFSEGFCIAGEDTAAFLEDALAKLGLNRREANEFIVYWLPLMEVNPYNLIAFQGEAYTSHAELAIFPAPDTLIRVFMAWQGLEEAVEIEPQQLTAPERTGFTVVEWGGSEIQ